MAPLCFEVDLVKLFAIVACQNLRDRHKFKDVHLIPRAPVRRDFGAG